MGLFSPAQIEQINKVAAKSKEILAPPQKSTSTRSINAELNTISQNVLEYFKDSKAILINSVDELHKYIDLAINAGYASIDTETTGLDRVKDYIVGASLYYPGGVECYIPMKHIVPIFEEPYKGQLSYEEVSAEFKRLENSNINLIFANADFDLSMIYKDLGADLTDRCIYDTILAWRCLKENEKDNTLKGLYCKYVLKGKGDPKKFSDFFSPALFPYCKPEIAKLYAANDAKITYELYLWQLPYLTSTHPKCKKAKLEAISNLVWNVEFPLIKVCQQMHRTGMYLDKDIARTLDERYQAKYNEELVKLSEIVDKIILESDYTTANKRPFRSGKDFNPSSPKHVQYLLYNMMKLPAGDGGGGTGKEILGALNLPVTNQILKVRSLSVLINTFVKKLPNATTEDSRIHAQFKSVGADTGRMSSAEPNMQNIPSHATDIRHMFRATAATSQILDCQYDGTADSIFIELPKIYYVHTPDGEKKVEDLQVGDLVKLQNDGKEIYKNVKSVENSNKDTSLCNVIF